MHRSLNSPCIRNCCLDQNDICLGCYRSLEEIMRWSCADQHTRLAILDNADIRRTEAVEKTMRIQPHTPED